MSNKTIYHYKYYSTIYYREKILIFTFYKLKQNE